MRNKLKLLIAYTLWATAVPAHLSAQVTTAETDAAAPLDPERLRLAEKTAAKLFRDGIYQQIMQDPSDTVLSKILDMDPAILKSAAIALNAGEDSMMIEQAIKEDPDFKERITITMKVYNAELALLYAGMEPIHRSALAKVYARKFSAQQLTDMNIFFATPSGENFAANYMAAFMDKELLEVGASMASKMFEKMPQVSEKITAATAHLPPSKFLGTSETSDPYSAETGDEPWYDGTNWTAAQRNAVNKLSDEYLTKKLKGEAAYEAYAGAEKEAVEVARKRFLAQGWKPEIQRKHDGATAGPAGGPTAKEGTPEAAARPQ